MSDWQRVAQMVLLTCGIAARPKPPSWLADDFHHMLTELDVDTAEAETLMQLAGAQCSQYMFAQSAFIRICSWKQVCQTIQYWNGL